MEREIKLRKKRFWLCMLLAGLICYSISAVVVHASSVVNGETESAPQIAEVTPEVNMILQPGDTLSTDVSYTIYYIDVDDTYLRLTTGDTSTIAEYNSSCLEAEIEGKDLELSETKFYGWKVTNTEVMETGSGGTVVSLKAIKACSITYIDGDTAINIAPSTYGVGIGVTNLETIAKEGYVFDGWYKEADYSGVMVESISTSETEDITLYAKWTQVMVPDVGVVTPVRIEASGSISLEAGVAYTLGDGTWKVAGDDTVYAGGITFYVDMDTEYEFIKQ